MFIKLRRFGRVLSCWKKAKGWMWEESRPGQELSRFPRRRKERG